LKKVWEYLESFVVIALIVAGLAGFLYNLLREGGWLGTALGEFWEFQFTNPVISVVGIAVLVALFVWWRDRRVALGRISRLPSFAIYALMAAGAYYIGHYAIHGTL
jgi:hypothetical protein